VGKKIKGEGREKGGATRSDKGCER